MKSTVNTAQIFLLLLLATFTVVSVLAQEPESLPLEKGNGKRTPTTNRPIPRKRPRPVRQRVPPSPPRKGGRGGGRGGGGGGNGGGRGRGGQVVLFVSPAIEGEHRIVVQIRPSVSGGFGGQTVLPTNPQSLTADNSNNESLGRRIEDAAFIGQPENLSIGCVFKFGDDWQDSVPRPMFYGDFLQSPVERMDRVYCSTQWND